jgi:hypothetical protein
MQVTLTLSYALTNDRVTGLAGLFDIAYDYIPTHTHTHTHTPVSTVMPLSLVRGDLNGKRTLPLGFRTVPGLTFRLLKATVHKDRAPAVL